MTKLQLEKAREQNEEIKQRIARNECIDENDTEFVPEEVFTHVERMLNILSLSPFEIRIDANSYTGTLDITCGNINPDIMHSLCGVDDGLAGTVICMVYKDSALLWGLYSNKYSMEKHEDDGEITSLSFETVNEVSVARAILEKITRFVHRRSLFPSSNKK